MRSISSTGPAVALAIAWCVTAPPVLAWGDEGHEVVALIADHFLDPAVRGKVHAMLAADPDNLTAHDIAREATWADQYWDSDQERHRRTWQWHFVDIEVDHPDLDAACFGWPPLPAGMLASNGPEQDCVVDKIEQFSAELASPATTTEERLTSLKFLLHFVGDVHQPLHAADNHDAGGNRVRVAATGFRGQNLHAFWDFEVVENMGDDPKEIADDLIGGIEQNHAFQAMSQGAPRDWAMEAFALAKDHAYGKLPARSADGTYVLAAPYVTDAIETARVQLARAGARLAALLNHRLAQR